MKTLQKFPEKIHNYYFSRGFKFLFFKHSFTSFMFLWEKKKNPQKALLAFPCNNLAKRYHRNMYSHIYTALTDVIFSHVNHSIKAP